MQDPAQYVVLDMGDSIQTLFKEVPYVNETAWPRPALAPPASAGVLIASMNLTGRACFVSALPLYGYICVELLGVCDLYCAGHGR